jgi:hypothetical protein
VHKGVWLQSLDLRKYILEEDGLLKTAIGSFKPMFGEYVVARILEAVQ